MSRFTGFFFIFIISYFFRLTAQGGFYNFQLLNTPENAVNAALGGNNFLLRRPDLLFASSSEALTNNEMHRQIILHFGDYVSNLHYFSLRYAHDFGHIGTTSFGFRYMNYGKFNGYDEFDNPMGKFYAYDYLFHAGIARSLPEDTNFRVGLRMNALFSVYDKITASALSWNLSGHYHFNDLYDVSIQALNVGVILKDFYKNSSYPSRLPTDVVLSFGHKLKKAPIRFLWNYHQLLKWNIKYDSPLDTVRKNTLFDNRKKEDTTQFRRFMINTGKNLDLFLRHLVLGIHFEFSRNFSLFLGYNHKRQKEMILTERRGINWLSFGFLIHTRRFSFSYAYNQMGFGGRANSLSISVPIWFRKKSN